MTASVSLRKGEKLPEILNEEEQKTLLSVPNLRCPTAIRNFSLILIMLDCGLRSKEIVNLQAGDVDLKTGKVTVRNGKGGKDRQLWAAERTLDAVRRWVEKRAKLEIDSEYLYTTLKGKQLDTSYLRHMCARYGKRADIGKRIHPHTLRHSFATDLYRQTKDIRMVQKALGHSDLSSTMIYTHLVDEELENGMKALRR